MKNQAEQKRQDRDSLLQILFKTFLYTVFTLLHTNHLFLFPILLTACQEIDESSTEIMTKSAINDIHIKRLDLYSYSSDKSQRIITLQSIEDPRPSESMILRTGKQRIIGIANLEEVIPARYCSSISSLNKYTVDITYEDHKNPIMIADTVTEVMKDSSPVELRFKPLLCRIRIEEIKRDFKGKPYEDLPIENIRIYLTNVLREQAVLSTENSKNHTYINFRGLSEQDLKEMKDPYILYMDGLESLKEKSMTPKECLYCYPNLTNHESASEAMTRLVIEGMINGVTYYYPINIFQDGQNIKGNTEYVFDITIRSLGNLNPDIVVNPLQISINSHIQKWEENEEENIVY